MADIDSLSIQISTDATSAEKGLDTLSTTLGRLRDATKGGLGLSSIASQVKKLSDSANGANGTTISNLKGLADGMKKLSEIGDLKISSSIANQITKINTALSGLNIGDGANKISELVSALKPLETLGKSSLSSTVTALNKLPEALKKLDTRQLYTQIQSLTRIMQPLATEMDKIAKGFNAFPSRIQKLIQSNERLNTSNTKVSTSYVNLYAKLKMVYNTMKMVTKTIAGFIKKSNDYIENLNLFNASMGSYADEAQKYAEQVSEVMGIDPGEWMRNQGVFMTLATGFGVVSDRAYIMSKNLTQLGYDLSSFFNISYEDAMLKLQSGLAGELEPLRRIGYDLSVARLQQEAYTLGITKKVAKMTQAEKAELRYHAILTQVTTAQGDMARTLNAPANQLRVLKAQVEMAGRAIGNIFIPALNAILPVAIAVIKVIRVLAESIASFLGFELPEVDYSGLSGMTSGAEDLSNALDDASDSAKKLQQYTMGFDELNVIDPNKGKSGSGSDGTGGSGFDFELPEYDFIGDAVEGKAETIFNNIKDRLGEILITVGLIGAGMLAWKISTSLFTSLGSLLQMMKNPVLGTPMKITGGIILTVTGAAIEFVGLKSAIENGLDGLNFTEIVGGGGTLIGGAAMIGSAFGSAVIGAAIGAIVAGVPMVFVGIYDACVNGLNWLNGLLIPIGTTLTGAAIGAMIGSIGGPLGAGIGALVGIVIDNFLAILGKEKKDVGRAIGRFLSESLLYCTSPFGMIIKWIENIFDFEIDWRKIGEALGKGLGEAVKFVGNWLNPIGLCINIVKAISEIDWKKVGETLKTYAVKAFDVGGDILKGIAKGFANGWNDFWSDVKSFIDGFVNGFKEVLGIHSPSTVFIGIAEDIVLGLIQGIKDFFGDTKDSIETWATSVKDWFTGGDGNGNIFDKFSGFASDIVDKFKTGVGGTYSTVKETITGWASSVKDWFTSEDDGGTIFDKFASYGGTLVSNLKTAIDNGVVQEKYETIFGRITTAITTVKDNIKTVINGIIGFIETMANGVVKGINTVITALNSLKIDVPQWVTDKFGIKDFGFNITTLKEISIDPLATGGMPETGQMFIAREAGPELVGTIGNKSAVVNNEQIVASVSRGVAEANNEQNSLLREQNTLLRALLEKESGVYLDGKRLTNSVEKYQSQRGRQIVVGGAV